MLKVMKSVTLHPCPPWASASCWRSLVPRSYLTVQPYGCRLPGSSVPGILQARILECVSHVLLQIFPTQGLNLDLLYCRQILFRWATREAPTASYQSLSSTDSTARTPLKQNKPFPFPPITVIRINDWQPPNQDSYAIFPPPVHTPPNGQRKLLKQMSDCQKSA